MERSDTEISTSHAVNRALCDGDRTATTRARHLEAASVVARLRRLIISRLSVAIEGSPPAVSAAVAPGPSAKDTQFSRLHAAESAEVRFEEIDGFSNAPFYQRKQTLLRTSERAPYSSTFETMSWKSVITSGYGK